MWGTKTASKSRLGKANKPTGGKSGCQEEKPTGKAKECWQGDCNKNIKDMRKKHVSKQVFSTRPGGV